jgi:hypothetical protein
MNTPALPDHDKPHRFPSEIISHAVWLYFRFCLSCRDVEELLFARGMLVTDEAMRQRCRRFGQPYARAPRHRRPKPGDKWHMDEVFLTIERKTHINPPASESGGCKGSRRRDEPNDFSPPMVRSHRTSDRDATCSPPQLTAKR